MLQLRIYLIRLLAVLNQYSTYNTAAATADKIINAYIIVNALHRIYWLTEALKMVCYEAHPIRSLATTNARTNDMLIEQRQPFIFK